MSAERDDDDLPLSRSRPVQDDVRHELEFHLQERARELEARGLSPAQAKNAASESFGDRAAVEEACREIEQRRRTARKRAFRMASLQQDVRVGLRVLRKSPMFTAAAIFMLALGIGATSAVFSIVNAILLRPLPFEQADRLVVVQELHDKGGRGNVPWANFLDIQAQSRSFSAITSYGMSPATVLINASAARVNVGVVSSGFFKVFPVRPFKGRLFLQDEQRIGANAVAVISYAFWRDQLGAPPSLDGVHLRIEQDHAVIGVLPADFDFPAGNQVWIPMEFIEQSLSRTSHNWDVVGRLQAGASVVQAQRETDGILAQLRARYYPDFDAEGSSLVALREAQTGSYRTPLYLLLAASGLVMLTACVNLASAMLARGTARSGEFSVRLALGATRQRLIRQLLTESALLALGGCVAGLAVAALFLRFFASIAPDSLHLGDVTVDVYAQLFAVLMAVLTMLLSGLFPALRLSGANLSPSLRDGARGTSGLRRMRIWNVLVATEVALAVVLLSGSALLVKSFTRVMQNDLGFEPDPVTTVRVNLPNALYGDTSVTVSAFHERLLERLRDQPGIDAVAFTNVLPMAGANPSGALQVEGKPLNPRGDFNAYSIYRVGGGDLPAALGVPLLEGRWFRTGAESEGSPVVVVNEVFARTEWPAGGAVGKRVRVAGMDGDTEPWYTVIGVVGSVRSTSPTSQFTATYYFDHRHRPAYRSQNVSYVVRTSLKVAALAPLVRREVAALDPQVPVTIERMSDRVAQTTAPRRFPMLIMGAFAGVALTLAAVGIFAVVSYVVAQRTREIGVRLALGATPAGVRTLVLRAAMTAVVPGLIAGTLMALVNARIIASLLYDVSPSDPLALLTGVGALGLAAFVSSAVPAYRATRVDPLIAMRAE